MTSVEIEPILAMIVFFGIAFFILSFCIFTCTGRGPMRRAIAWSMS